MFSGYNIYQKKGTYYTDKFGKKELCDRDILIASGDSHAKSWFIIPEVSLLHPDFKIETEQGNITVYLDDKQSSKDFYCTKTKDYECTEYPINFKKAQTSHYIIHKYKGASIKYYTKENYRKLVKSRHIKKSDKISILGINPMGDIFTEDHAKYDSDSDSFSNMDSYYDNVLFKPTSPMGIVVNDRTKYYPDWYKEIIEEFVNATTIRSKLFYAMNLLEKTKENFSELTYADVDNERIKLPIVQIKMIGPCAGWQARFDEHSYITVELTNEGVRYYVNTTAGSGNYNWYIDDIDEAIEKATSEFHFGKGRTKDIRTMTLDFVPSGYGDCKSNYNSRQKYVDKWKIDNKFKPKERFMFSMDGRVANVYAENEVSALEKAKKYADKCNFKNVERFDENKSQRETFHYNIYGINIT